MLGSEHAADAVWLEHELDGRRDGPAAGVANSAADMPPWSRPARPIASGATPIRTPNFVMDSQTPAKDPNLLEREAELEALDRALAAAVEGRGSVVAVEGPPGIGKSRLVTSCAELARARGMYTVSVRATELERSYPYGIVRQTRRFGRPRQDRRGARGAVRGRGEARAADPGSAAAQSRPTTPS